MNSTSPRKKKEKMPTLTFRIKTYKDGEWVAQCKEIKGILTGGKNSTKEEIAALIYDATVCALGYGVKIIYPSLKPRK